MSKGLYDLNSETERKRMEEARRVLLAYMEKRWGEWGAMFNEKSENKICIGCGSSTQPCCGH